jgi:gliding motility-associated-like protein
MELSIAQVVSQPIAQVPTSVCAGDTLQLATQFVDNAIYHWTGPDGFVSEDQNPVVFPVTADASGAYQVTVQIGECISDISDSASVMVLPLPLIPQADLFEGSICLGDPSPATLCITQNTLTSGALYTWMYQGAALNVATTERCITVSDFTGFAAGVNSIDIVAELNGCTSAISGALEIPMYDIPEIMADAGPDASYCMDDEIMLNASFPSSGTGSWSSLDGSITFDDINDPFTGVANLGEGESVFIWTLDFESCLQYSSDTVTVFIESTPVAVRDSVFVPFGQTVDINVIVNDFVPGAYIVSLLPGGPVKGNILYRGQGVFSYDPNLGYVGPDKFTYEICSVVCPDQCTMVDVIIQVGDESDCFIPTIFTPNGDGTNDLLIIPCLETSRFPENRMVIFNEWGDVVYEARPYYNDWDGTRDGKDLPVATYFYIIDFGDGRPVQNGFLILER